MPTPTLTPTPMTTTTATTTTTTRTSTTTNHHDRNHDGAITKDEAELFHEMIRIRPGETGR